MIGRRLTGADFEQMAERVVVEAFNDATRVWWLRRAEEFEAAKYRAGDYPGRATVEELREQWRRCDDAARACRAKAEVLEPRVEVAELLAGIRGEAA